MDLSQINYLAVAVAALSSFLIGGLWYSPILFAKAWMRETGLSEEELGKDMGRTFGVAFALSLLSAFNLAAFLGPDANWSWGMTAGVLAAVWVGSAMAITFAFERRSAILTVIDAGYHLVAYAVMGGILGAWH